MAYSYVSDSRNLLYAAVYRVYAFTLTLFSFLNVMGTSDLILLLYNVYWHVNICTSTDRKLATFYTVSPFNLSMDL